MRDLIFLRVRIRLARRLPRLGDEGERGAIGVLVAILIGAGVLVGMGALVVDVGQLYQNRAELQNGADAAALAVAKSCIEGTCTPSIATQYADANASQLTGGTADVNLVCGSSASLGGGCPASTGAITDCPAAPPAGTNYVDVHTSTELANGSHLLPPVFARTLAGNGSYQGSTVYACAQAEWGAPLTLDSIGLTISACIWNISTSDGTSFSQPPPYPPDTQPPASADQVIYLKNPNGFTGSCSTLPNGSPSPGNFGWTQDPNNPSSCTVVINSTTNTYGGSTGVSANQCSSQIYNAWLNKTLIYIPVYFTDSVSGTGNNTQYTLDGFAAFVMTGYRLSGMQGYPKTGADWLNPSSPCTNPGNGSADCITGFFTKALVPAPGPFGPPPDLGLDVVKLTG